MGFTPGSQNGGSVWTCAAMPCAEILGVDSSTFLAVTGLFWIGLEACGSCCTLVWLPAFQSVGTSQLLWACCPLRKAAAVSL